MIRRIELRNFMSHSHTVIEPAAGLTVLIGPNNCGKSAVVAALQILCDNDNSTYVMRHGEKECSVSVEVEDGHTIVWRRRKSPSYLIDGKECSRKLSDPEFYDELHQVLRLRRVDAGNDADFDVHFGTQKTPIFLLASSAGNAAKFFASSSDAIRLVEMQKRHKDKLAQAQREKNRLEAESKRLTLELELLVPSVELDQRVEQIEKLREQLVDDVEHLKAATSHADELALQTQTQQEKFAVSRSLAALVSPPILGDVVSLAAIVEQIDQWQQRLNESGDRMSCLSALVAAPQLPDVTPLINICDRLSALIATESFNSAQQIALDNLKAPPPITPVDGLAADIVRMESLATRTAKLAANHAVAETITAPPLQHDTAALATLVTRMETGETTVARCRFESSTLSHLVDAPPRIDVAELELTTSRLAEMEQRFAKCQIECLASEKALLDALSELRILAAESTCATCGAPLDPDRVVAQAALVAAGGAR